MPRSSRSDDEYSRDVFELLEHAVRDEITVDNAIVGLGLTDEAIEQLAVFLGNRLDQAFRFTWEPRWVKPGDPHVWSQDGANHARCTECLQVQTDPSFPELLRWHAEHRRTSHGASE